MTSIPILENQRVKLSPLTSENCGCLLPVASEPGLVEYSPSFIETPETLRSYVDTAIRDRENKSGIPFIIYDKKTAAYAGCTRFMNIDWPNKVLHIGAT